MFEKQRSSKTSTIYTRVLENLRESITVPQKIGYGLPIIKFIRIPTSVGSIPWPLQCKDFWKLVTFLQSLKSNLLLCELSFTGGRNDKNSRLKSKANTSFYSQESPTQSHQRFSINAYGRGQWQVLKHGFIRLIDSGSSPSGSAWCFGKQHS